MGKEQELLAAVRVLMRVMLISERTPQDFQHVVHFNALDFHLLNALRDTPGLRASALADFLGVAPTTLSSVIARMIKKGFVSRTQAKDDKRAYDLALTDTGQVIAEAIYTQDLKNMGFFLAALEDAEQDQFIDLLNKVRQRVEALEN